jgi:Aminoglycoside-2''-adenylyltransferase
MSELPWQPLSLDDAVKVMVGYAGPWWVAGGWAIDLHVERLTREHADVDLVVLRDNQSLLRRFLAGWDVRVAHRGALEPWNGFVVPPRHGLWARREPEGPWELEFLLAETDGDTWLSRHDDSISMPLAEVVLRNPEGIPYLRPELVLLHKSRNVRERDEWDFDAVLPFLSADARAWLRDRLEEEHPWRPRL